MEDEAWTSYSPLVGSLGSLHLGRCSLIVGVWWGKAGLRRVLSVPGPGVPWGGCSGQGSVVLQQSLVFLLERLSAPSHFHALLILWSFHIFLS